MTFSGAPALNSRPERVLTCFGPRALEAFDTAYSRISQKSYFSMCMDILLDRTVVILGRKIPVYRGVLKVLTVNPSAWDGSAKAWGTGYLPFLTDDSSRVTLYVLAAVTQVTHRSAG